MRATTAGLYVLGLIAGCSSVACSSNRNRPDPNAEQRENERIRADAADANQSLQKEEDKRDDAQTDQPNRR